VKTIEENTIEDGGGDDLLLCDSHTAILEMLNMIEVIP